MSYHCLKLLKLMMAVKAKRHLKHITGFRTGSYFLVVYSVSVFLVHIGGNNIEIKTEADGNDITCC